MARVLSCLRVRRLLWPWPLPGCRAGNLPAGNRVVPYAQWESVSSAARELTAYLTDLRAKLFARRECRSVPMTSVGKQFEVLVVGGGPAGLAAAARASEQGARVGIVDDNAKLGGQI